MASPGWQQPPLPPKIRVPKKPQCFHLGLIMAQFESLRHAEGHEWVCVCGKKFVVVTDGGKEKRLLAKGVRA